MPQSSRQSSLFGVQDWKRLYQSFTDANLSAYDYESLRNSFIEYIRLTNGETFNDFVESSEFVALLDVIAFMGQSLAFRSDLNARENFIDTAERRDSVIKLANLVGYTPKRNISGQGQLKIVSIQTTENITDINGNNLGNSPIQWNDTSNQFWKSQFNSVINAALVSSQYIGNPGNRNNLLNVITDEYAINIPRGYLPIIPFTAVVDGISMPFELVSASSQGTEYLYEQSPSLSGQFNLLFRNDKLGNGSSDTGWFVYFKQGTLQNFDFSFTNSIENNIQDINIEGINDEDTWLFKMNSAGDIIETWTQVESVFARANTQGNNSNRKIYSVRSRFNDQVSYVFGDGVVSEIPVGTFRAYVRTGNGLNYRIDTSEMQGIRVALNYVSRIGRTETLSFVLELQRPVTTALSRESLSSIKQRAPSRYYTQNRMVNGEDYTNFPYTLYNSIIKSKAINRSSVGVSRSLDLLDPTGKYSSANIYADDGAIWVRNYDNDLKVPTASTTFSLRNMNFALQFLTQTFQTLLQKPSSLHYYHSEYPRFDGWYEPAADRTLYWNLSTVNTDTVTGYFYIKIPNFPDQPTSIGSANGYSAKYITEDSLIKFAPPLGYTCFDKNNRPKTTAYKPEQGDKLYIWAGVVRVVDDGSNYGTGNLDNNIGPVTLSEYVPVGSRIAFNRPDVAWGNFTATVSGLAGNFATLTVTAMWGGEIQVSDYVYVDGDAVGFIVTAFDSGTGQEGTYTIEYVEGTPTNIPNAALMRVRGITYDGTSISVKTRVPHNLIGGQLVTITGTDISSSPEINGVARSAEIITDTQIRLWQTWDPVSGFSGACTTGVDGGWGGTVATIPDSIIASMDSSLSDSVINSIIQKIQLRQSFALKFDNTLIATQDRWSMIQPVPAANSPVTDYWMKFEYQTLDDSYRVSYRSMEYIFGSVEQTRFFFETTEKIYDPKTGKTISDFISIMLPTVPKLRLDITNQPVELDGFRDDYSVEITSIDANTGFSNNPDFFRTAAPDEFNGGSYPYVFFQKYTDTSQVIRWSIVPDSTIVILYRTKQQVLDNLYVFSSGTRFYTDEETTGTMWQSSVNTDGDLVLTNVSDSYKVYPGNGALSFQYRHNSNNTTRIDPATTNLIDVYVVTQSYYTAYLNWLADSTGIITKPLKPTINELRQSYGKLEQYKMLTDTVIINSVEFKPLFGSKAETNLQGTIKIVKNPLTSVSDSQIRSSVLAKLNSYFSLSNWDFGDTFYFSELSAYLHRELGDYISSVVIVPTSTNSKFGALFEVRSAPYEIFVNGASTEDIVVVSSLNSSVLGN